MSKFSQWHPSHRDTHLCSWTIMNLGAQSVPNPNPSPPSFPSLPPTVPSSHNKQAVFPQCATQTAALSKWNTHSQGLASFLSPTQQVEHAQPVSGLLPTPRVRRHSLACARKDFGTPRLLPEWKRLGSIHLEVNSYSQRFVLSFEQLTSCALE